MIFLIFLIMLYSVIYLTVYILAHRDANLIMPLTCMTAGMLFLLFITAILSLFSGYPYISIVVFIVMTGLLRFFLYLLKY